MRAMNSDLSLFILRMLALLLIASNFFTDYKVSQRYKQLIALKDDTIAAMQRTIDAQEKNIEVRKNRMGY